MNRFLFLTILSLFFLFSCRTTAPDGPGSSIHEEERPLSPEEQRRQEELARIVARDAEVTRMMDAMSDEEKIGQLLILAIRHSTNGRPALRMDDYVASFIERYKPGGIILFSINCDNADQTASFIKEFQDKSSIPLFIATDEEGGKVSRLGRNKDMKVYSLPPAAQIGASGDPEISEEASYLLALDLKELGFNFDMAPVADVSRKGAGGRVIGSRSFSSDPETAALMTAAAVRGFQRAGVASVIKHFPGHGNVSGDTHTGFVRSLSSGDEFRSIDFLPFIKGIEAGVPFLMMGHIAAPSLTGNNLPASLSPTIQQDIVRGELGFEGLIITDAMDMGAINKSYGSGEAALRAVNAGIDIILMPENPREAQKSLMDALKDGRLSRERLDESVKRILNLKMDLIISPDSSTQSDISEDLNKEERHARLSKLLNN